MEKKSFLATELLCFFLGALGVHRFYTGYVGIGIVQLLTVGGCGIWALIDLIMISLNKYRDANGEELEEYNKTVGYVVLIIAILLFVLSLIGHSLGGPRG